MVKTPYLGEISAQCIEGASHDDRLEHGLASNWREKKRRSPKYEHNMARLVMRSIQVALARLGIQQPYRKWYLLSDPSMHRFHTTILLGSMWEEITKSNGLKSWLIIFLLCWMLH